MFDALTVKRGKSDAIDAEAICEAVTRPKMRFVAIKTEEQQGVLFLHRARDLVVRQRTQLSNMLRGLLGEFGIMIAQGIGSAVTFAKAVRLGRIFKMGDRYLRRLLVTGMTARLNQVKVNPDRVDP